MKAAIFVAAILALNALMVDLDAKSDCKNVCQKTSKMA